ncbi:MAG TPA: tetratricopeptide repeat protein [Chthonomonadales bacterium]|nr:tetratricopeptide repeat protein [Chthonomonadales bacterium]
MNEKPRHRYLCPLLLAMLPVVFGVAGCSIPAALRSDPIPSEVRVGAQLLRQGERGKAQAQFDAAVRKQPSDPTVYLAIAAACQPHPDENWQGDWELFLLYIQKGIEATPKASKEMRALLYHHAGIAYGALDNPQKALEANRKAYELEPTNITYMNNLGYTLAEMPGGGVELEKALKLTSEAVRIARSQGKPDKEIGIYLDSLGWVHYKMKNFKDALAVLTRAAELSPDEPEIHYHCARVYEAMGRLNDAFVMLQRALRKAPDHREAQEMLEEIVERLPKPQNNASPQPPMSERQPRTDRRRLPSILPGAPRGSNQP